MKAMKKSGGFFIALTGKRAKNIGLISSNNLPWWPTRQHRAVL